MKFERRLEEEVDDIAEEVATVQDEQEAIEKENALAMEEAKQEDHADHIDPHGVPSLEVKPDHAPNAPEVLPRRPLKGRLIAASLVYLSVTLLLLILFCLLSISSTTSRWLLPLLVGPPFAVLRFLLAPLNRKWPRFPLFTFLPNIAGTLLWGLVGVCSPSGLVGDACVLPFATN